MDNDGDLDVLVSCKRCPGGSLFRNDGAGRFTDDSRALPQYTNNYEFEPMDLDGDGFLDLVTLNDGDIVKESSASRREHVFRNDGKGRFRDATDAWWPDDANVGEDDNMAAFLDVDSDGDADFVIGSLSGPDRLLTNDGRGRLRVRLDAFDGAPTPGTLGLALADLDGDGAISRLEFRQDAEAFFARLDPNDDKVIDADEMREYEHLAPGRTRAAAGGAQAKGATSDRTKGPGELEREKGHVPIVADGTAPTVSRVPKGGSGPITLATNVPQPVAMADLNIDRRVTLDEFTKTASRRFTNYDQDQDGRLTRKELAGTTR